MSELNKITEKFKVLTISSKKSPTSINGRWIAFLLKW